MSSRRTWGMACLLVVALAGMADAAVIYVSAASGNDANDGLSWATAKASVGAGLSASVSGDQVWVAAGTYVENITLKDGVALYGGFVGNEDPATFDLADRNLVANNTILDGNSNGSVVIAPQGATETTRIDGFTIRNGSASYGGGIYCFYSSPTIANNTITANTVSSSGGGIYCEQSSPAIANSTITGNTASISGGGICCTFSSATIANNTIAGNDASTGGGIYCNFGSSPTVAGNTITANTASSSGGGICCYSPSATITNNAVTGNTASSSGGGIYCGNSSATITSNTITGNTASSSGGGIYCGNSSATITSNTLTKNGASSGGGIYCNNSSPTIANNTITANTVSYVQGYIGGYGGGICCDNSSPTIANNTITGNTATYAPGHDGGYGGGVYCSASSPTIANNTITGNTATKSDGGGGICCGDSSPTVANTIIAFNSSGISNTGSGTPVLRHNCVFGNTSYDYSGIIDPTGTDGNLSADPKLASMAYGNAHVQPASPCIEAGDNAYAFGDYDMDGQPRIQPGGATVDIGADESDGTLWPDVPNVIVRVSPDGDDANDGSSWAQAKRTVQAGVDAASALGGDVWVRAGTYYERITLHLCAHLYGGFAGTETAREQRDWAANETILDGEAGGSVISIKTAYQTNTVDGFTVRNGSASAGGGIYCYYSSPTIANNKITGNSGRGVSCTASSPTITNNTITGNGGGGISCSGSPTITNNTITRNTATSEGGGIYCSAGFSPTIVNTIVAFNSSGIYTGASSTPSLRHNCVFGNTDYNYSGITDPTGTDGNISADPRLAEVTYGSNVHIQPDSPCIEAGDNAYALSDYDMDGQPRIQPGGGTVDIGADESDGTLWPEGPFVIVRVSPDGDDANDGSSWAQAKQTVQAGIDVAGALGGEVWVRAGTYDERITLPPYAYLYGGFAGTETARDQRDWATNDTILDGQAGGNVVSIQDVGWQVNTIDGFTIRNGGASSGCGVYCLSSSSTIANNTITGNEGGGIYCSGGFPTIANNTIAGNGAGGIFCFSSAMIANNTITGNIGSGIRCYSSSATIAHNTITGNAASGAGGGIYCYYCSPTIANNTITNNSASSGGGIYCDVASNPTIANTIVAFNSSGVCARGGRGGGAAVLLHSCVFDNGGANYIYITDPTGTDGNISVDPLLVQSPDPGPDGVWGTADDDYGDVHLKAGSPCVDAGDNTLVPAGAATDRDGHPRIADGDGNGSAVVDMGAYEYPAIPPDVDFDGDVDLTDFGAFSACFNGPNRPPAAADCSGPDLDDDADVDLADFGLFSACFNGPNRPPAAGCP